MIAYVLKSAIYLSIMYAPYMLLLKKESFFRFNRGLLLGIMLLSLILPLCNFHALALEENPIQQGISMIAEPIVTTTDGNIAVQTVTRGHQSSTTLWWFIAICVYLLGILLTFTRKVVQIALLYRAIHTGVLWEEEENGITVYCHGKDIAPFCWFRSIVISEKDYNNNASEILQHEMGHVVNKHSWDILLVSLIQIIQWWNPLAWKLETSLRDVHEYEADNAVLTSGVNAHQYQLLLIKKAAESSSLAFADSFNQSIIKKRITMMLKSKSNPWMRTKALYLLPVAAMMLCIFATPELNESVNVITEKATKIEEAVKKLELNHQPVTKETVAKILKEEVAKPVEETPVTEEKQEVDEWGNTPSKNYTDNNGNDRCTYEEYIKQFDYIPEFPNGDQGFGQYIRSYFKKLPSLENKNVSHEINIVFDIALDGTVGDIRNIYISDQFNVMSNNDRSTLEAEAKKLITNMPKWNPSKSNGTANYTRYTLKLQFDGNSSTPYQYNIKRHEEG